MEFTPQELTLFATLFIGTIFTSIISAVTGMGGGVTLVSIMTFFFQHSVLVPIHGIVQLTSNGSRSLFLLKYVRHKWMVFFSIGAILGAWSAYYLVSSIDEFYPKLLIALLIFYVLFKPKKLPELKIPLWSYSIVGFFSANLGVLIGATGPFLAAFFIRDDIEKEELVATKAAMQVFVHLIKIPVFIGLGFQYSDHLIIIIVMSVAAIIGTKMGVGYLKRINKKLFNYAFKSILFLAALRILYKLFI